LLQAHAQRFDRAVGEERRPLRHCAHWRLIANFARRVSVVMSAKAFTPARTPAGGSAGVLSPSEVRQ
jgi:hypothetical protein